MASAVTSPGGTRRRSRITRALLGLAVTALTLGLFTQEAGASRNSCTPTSTFAPLVGSWFTQVHFPGQPLPGVTAATMATFIPGGGTIEVNPVNPPPAGNSGHWRLNRDCSYSVRLLVFDWEATGVEQLADIRLRLVMDDPNHFHSTSASATVYNFDPQTGERLGDPIPVPNLNQTTGERLGGWTVPESFPPLP